MKPSEYKEEYENLSVNIGDGQATTVNIHQYRLGDKATVAAARKALLDKVGHKGITDFELRVGLDGTLAPVDVEFTKTEDFKWCLRGPFKGKGAPEHCQLVLQLVNHFNLAEGGDLQKYADNFLGLDCNGFVGNYIMHDLKNPKADWTDHGLGPKNNHREGPDMRIDGFYDRRRHSRINDWDQLDFATPYLLMRAKEDDGGVMATNTGENIGHIVISESGWAARQGNDKRDQLNVVESTATHRPPGLCRNWYRYDKEKKTGKNSIFRIDRGPSFLRHRYIWFVIARL